MDNVEMKGKPARKLGPVGIIVVGLIPLVIGFLLTFVWGYSDRQDGDASAYWPQAEGVVTASKFISRGSRKMDNLKYYPKVSYEYTVKGRTFTSSRIRFQIGGYYSTNRLGIEQIIKEYPVKKKIAVYYDPQDPAKSCLETGSTGGTTFLVGMLCMLIGFILIVSAIVAAIKSHGSRARIDE